MRLENRVAIVTGAQQGIGKAIALALGREGARVVVNYLDDRKSADETVRELKADGQEAIAVQGSVADAQDVAKLVAANRLLGWC